jgi:hypothetical protein
MRFTGEAKTLMWSCVLSPVFYHAVYRASNWHQQVLGLHSYLELVVYPAVALPAASLVGEGNMVGELLGELYVPKNEIEAYSPETSAGMLVGVQVGSCAPAT